MPTSKTGNAGPVSPDPRGMSTLFTHEQSRASTDDRVSRGEMFRIEPSNLRADQIRHALRGYTPRTNTPAQGLKPAAVLAPFHETPEGLTLVFTKRTNHLYNHRGQISFPGGRVDPEDKTDLDTALRETFEEIGVHPTDVDIWGRLNQEITTTNYTIAPFVGAVPYPYEFLLNEFEVERLIIVPLAFLLDPANMTVEYYHHDGIKYKIYRYAFNGDVIWGATARIVHNLTHFLTTGREPDETTPG
jgi:8-oxo-dGTP pyrophosphatase MutT (NUDIX family)